MGVLAAWLVALLVIGVPVWLLMRYLRAQRKEQPTSTELQGIGGWLAFLAFGICAGFLRNAAELAKDLASYPEAWMVQAAHVPLVIAAFSAVAYMALHLWTIIALFQKRAYFTRLFPVFWIAGALTPLAVVPMLTVPGITFDMLMPAEDIAKQLAAFIVTGLWYWYVRVSVRVRNTFVT